MANYFLNFCSSLQGAENTASCYKLHDHAFNDFTPSRQSTFVMGWQQMMMTSLWYLNNT